MEIEVNVVPDQMIVESGNQLMTANPPVVEHINERQDHVSKMPIQRLMLIFTSAACFYR